ncbi:hypothetical protein PLESTB_001535200 [Pleodorina starrii]|uniref:CSC1/OSCA1-like cytosolic domain-containing protein n=1 Tax=Pleodorina starrii TaxID=330485 RepID=A0A9W6BXR4_9CHLO|nr:hypothetical protein PLESTM_001840600 [Pleodorina starrii]GLC59782.1 hypothetical protein PLESTB_001535200 [Pleodorina starrii]GLC67332.1 hypothetical protein PLESTF_000543400 [Pleodorina starrii]
MSEEPGCLAKLRPKYRPSEAIREEYGPWEPPDEAAAREAYLQSHAHHGVFEVTCPPKDLKEFGDGVQLYFVLLKYIAVLFCFLAIMPGLLLASFNGIGGWYDEADLERTMLGNYGLLTHDGAGSGLNLTTSGISSRSVSSEGAVTALFASTAHLPAAKVGGMNKRSLLVAMSVLDLLGVLCFFAFGMGMIWHVRSRAAADDLSTTTIADYSVRVDNLPPETSAAALKDYLLAAGGEGTEIVEVELCRSVDSLLALVVERGQAVEGNELALAVVQRKAEVSPRVPKSYIMDLLYSRFLLEDITAAIRQEQAFSKTNEVVAAFVTFSHPDSRQRVMRALPRSAVKQWRMKPEQKFNNGGIGGARIKPVALDVSRAPEPSDIQYENLEYTRVERAMRAVATNIAKYLVLLIGFLLVSLAPAMRKGISGLGSGPDQTVCAANCKYTDGAGNFVLSTANRTVYQQCDPVAGTGALPNKLDCEALTVCYECYCRAALNAGEYGEVSYCARFSSVMGIYTAAQVLAVVGVVIANALIEFAITWLVRQEKHHTRTREAVGITRGLFLTTLANTAFSNLVANMYLPGPAGVISGSFLSGYIFTGSFADTSPNWYHDVCRPITISLFLTTIIVHLKIAFRWWWRRRCLAARYQCLTQRQMDDAYEGHTFELAIKYGQHLYVIYVVMVYSAGVPLLYMLAAVHFATCYWSEKYELLRLCKRPLAYSRDLAVYFTSSLPFAALWHLAFGTWFYSLFGVPKSPLIAMAFRRSLETSVAAFKSLMPVASALTPQLVAWRFTQNSAAHLFLTFIACGGILFIFFTTSTWVQMMVGLGKQLGLGLGSDDPAPAATAAAKAGTADGAGEGGEGGEGEGTGQQQQRQQPAVPQSQQSAAVSAVPEFSTAVRSQMLVGPASYAVQRNPAYIHAFVRMEELEWEARKEMEAKAAADALAYEAAAGLEVDPASLPNSTFARMKRTAANRLRAKQKAAAAIAVSRPSVAAAATTTGGRAVAPNQVLPEPMPPPPPALSQPPLASRHPAQSTPPQAQSQPQAQSAPRSAAAPPPPPPQQQAASASAYGADSAQGGVRAGNDASRNQQPQVRQGSPLLYQPLPPLTPQRRQQRQQQQQQQVPEVAGDPVATTAGGRPREWAGLDVRDF